MNYKTSHLAATRAVFLAHGFLLAAWAPIIPFVKARLDLGAVELSHLLLSIGIGGLLTMPFVGSWSARIGIRKTFYTLFAGMALSFPMISLMPSFWTTLFALVFFGAMIGGSDIAMNIQAIKVEEKLARPVMSGIHGMWSLGGFLGASAMSILLTLGIPPFFASLCASAVALLAAALVASGILNERAHDDAPHFVVPRGMLLYIGLLCFMLYLSEHAILDWGAVFLTKIRDMPQAQSGFGFAVFSLAMLIGRFSGDALRQRFGDKNLMFFGGLLAGAGFMAASLVPSLEMSLISFFIMGLGISNLVPILFALAGRSKLMPSHLAITAVATVSHAGILFGPPLIGFIAEWLGLQAAFLILGAIMVFISLNAKLLTRSYH